MDAVLDRPATATVKFSIDHYHHLIALGLLADHRVELLEGEIVRMTPASPIHSATVEYLYETLLSQRPPTHTVFSQRAITLSESEPEPDVLIANVSPTRYRDHHPFAHELALVIEVSLTSLAQDQGPKLGLYASASIPEYWVVDLENTVIHRYSDPQPTTRTYGSLKTLKPGDTITSITVPTVSLAVKDSLGV
jgi:Uma2 family endonuclease